MLHARAQVHLVMQFCDQGSLLGSLKAGTFWDDRACLPLLVRPRRSLGRPPSASLTLLTWGPAPCQKPSLHSFPQTSSFTPSKEKDEGG